MTQYMLSVWHTGELEMPPPEVMGQMFADVEAFNTEVREAGVWVFGGGLEMPATAKVVDATSADISTTDGPYAESKEWLGGFWVLELPDLDTALDYAARGSRACRGRVEVRPFQSE